MYLVGFRFLHLLKQCKNSNINSIFYFGVINMGDLNVSKLELHSSSLPLFTTFSTASRKVGKNPKTTLYPLPN